MFPNWAKNILFLLVYMLSGLVLVIIIEGVLSGTDLTPLNTAIEGTITHFRTPWLTSLMIVVTMVGSPFVLFGIACFLAVLLALRGDIRNALIVMVSMSVAVASFVLLKEVFQVSRPLTDLLDLDSWSFPSGHATVATAFFFALAHTFFGRIKTTLGRLSLVLVSILGAALVAFSRLYLGAHWTLDILAGIALGLVAVSFTVLVFSMFSGGGAWKPMRRRL
jgi:membrane-associated phospholipid phosphatase